MSHRRPSLVLIYWCPIFKSRYCTPFEEAPVDFIYRFPIFEWAAETWSSARILDSKDHRIDIDEMSIRGSLLYGKIAQQCSWTACSINHMINPTHSPPIMAKLRLYFGRLARIAANDTCIKCGINSLLWVVHLFAHDLFAQGTASCVTGCWWLARLANSDSKWWYVSLMFVLHARITYRHTIIVCCSCKRCPWL